jgi:hypothetical protein
MSSLDADGHAAPFALFVEHGGNVGNGTLASSMSTRMTMVKFREDVCEMSRKLTLMPASATQIPAMMPRGRGR